jgi:hypothetical protein
MSSSSSPLHRNYPCQKDPFGRPMDPFYRTMEEVLREFDALMRSQAVEKWKKDRMTFLIRQIDALVRNPKIHEEPIKRKMNELLDDLLALAPVSARPDTERIRLVLHDVRPRKQYWELVLVGHTYHVRTPGETQTSVAHGPHVFAILVSCPWQVLVGERSDGGHTAITRGADVYYAGEMFFNHGELERWNNDSGHYRPHTDFHKQVKNLLPMDRYKERES